MITKKPCIRNLAIEKKNSNNWDINLCPNSGQFCKMKRKFGSVGNIKSLM